jgi:hypothetical protein
MRWPRRSLAFVIAVLVASALWMFVGRDIVARRQALNKYRTLYARVQPFPGSEKVDEDVSEVTGDDGATGEFALTITYRLPETAKAATVLDHIRTHLPASWRVASDETCRTMMAAQPPPPVATFPDGTAETTPTTLDPRSFVLLGKKTRLTAFLGARDGTPSGFREGVTFELERRGADRLLHVHGPTYGCAQHDADTSDPFDAP